MDPVPGWILKTLLALAIFIVGILVGEITGKIELRKEAVKLEYAEYYLDRNYARQWRWRICIQIKEE